MPLLATGARPTVLGCQHAPASRGCWGWSGTQGQPLSCTHGEQSPPSMGTSAGSHTLTMAATPRGALAFEFSTKAALPRGASPLAHLLLDSQGLFCSQNNQEFLQRTPFNCFNLDFGVATGRKAKGRSPTELGMAGWDRLQVCLGQHPAVDMNKCQSSPTPEQTPPAATDHSLQLWRRCEAMQAISNTAHDGCSLKRWQHGWGRARRDVHITPSHADVLPWQGAFPWVSLAAINPLTLHHIYSLTAFYFGSHFPPLSHSSLAVNMLIYLNASVLQDRPSSSPGGRSCLFPAPLNHKLCLVSPPTHLLLEVLFSKGYING